MWLGLWIVTLVGLVALHLWWRRRHRELESVAERLRRTHEMLAEAHERDHQAAARRQAALFDSMVEGVLILDASHRVQLVNASLRAMFRVTGDLTGRTVMESFRLQPLQALVEQLPARGMVTGIELEPNSLDGQILQVNAVSLAGHTRGEGGSLLVFHDLTRLKQLENTRRDFVANVSHELRTPLSMIKGYVETLLDGAKDSPELSVRFLQTIDKHADRLLFLIEDLLAISSLESGQMTMNCQRTELADLVDRVVDELADRARARQTVVTTDVARGLAAHADRSRVQQVLFNLIDNAIKYGRSGGQIRVKGELYSGGFVQVSVADDGPGIPPEASERVFERFYRVDKARSREQGGTGLGLAIVKHIVQAHGGEVWLESSPGHGATFYFTLPRSSFVP